MDMTTCSKATSDGDRTCCSSSDGSTVIQKRNRCIWHHSVMFIQILRESNLCYLHSVRRARQWPTNGHNLTSVLFPVGLQSMSIFYEIAIGRWPVFRSTGIEA